MALKMVSHNTNGLQSKVKRRAIFKNCREAKSSFACYRRHTQHGSEWGGQISFAHRESNSTGVAILARKGCEFVIDNLEVDAKGRFLMVKSSKGPGVLPVRECLYAHPRPLVCWYER